jgi:toluene monooxygenase system protein D
MTGTSPVGPVLTAGFTASAVIAAIHELNTHVEIQDRGAYLRVEVAGRCVVTRAAIERALGRPFRIPQDLEPVMPSFSGFVTMTDDEIRWEAR